MIKKIKTYLFTAMTAVMMATPLLVPIAVSAAPVTNCGSNIANQVATGASDSSGSPGVDCQESGVGSGSVTKAAKKVVDLFSIIVGAVAIIMVIYGGFRYIISGGDSGRVGNAKNTLIYAIIGLVIVALAQLIVHFVLNQSDAITTSTAGP